MDELIQILNQPIDSVRAVAGMDLSAFEVLVEADNLDEGLPSEYVFSLPQGGIELHCDSQRFIKTIFLYSGVHGEFARYPCVISDGFSFESSPSEIHVRLGKPTRSAPAQRLFALGERWPWDRYDYETYSIHFEYTPDASSVALLTIMTSDVVP
jgi:hypothetical protein